MRLTTDTVRFVLTPEHSPRRTAVLLAGLFLCVFGLDRATGGAPIQHLYYVPIIVSAVGFKVRGGLLASLASIVLYHLANPHLLSFSYEELDVVQVALFLTVGLVTAKLTRDGDRLRHLALTDDLTGLHNLRSFESHLVAMVGASRRAHTPIALLVIDVDRLKTLNDQYGHLTGAEAVRTVGRLIARRIPADAVACRYGGDEFAIAIPRCTSHSGLRLAQDLCLAVHSTAPFLAGRSFAAGTLSISAGGTSMHVERGELANDDAAVAGETLFRAADAALYRAKAIGRNRAWVTDGPEVPVAQARHART